MRCSFTMLAGEHFYRRPSKMQAPKMVVEQKSELDMGSGDQKREDAIFFCTRTKAPYSCVWTWPGGFNDELSHIGAKSILFGELANKQFG